MYDSKKTEKEITEYWQKNGIDKKSITLNKGKERFYFLDGPPYATGSIHMGTAWNKIIKDYYIRYNRMLGYNVWVQPGYDTHGLPIENKVEKKLDLKNKDDIEKLGIEKFNTECMRFATEHIDTMNTEFKNLGVWMDWEHPYLTLDNSYIEGAWHTFKVGYKKGFLYKGIYPVHVCSHCATAVAYNEIEYEKATDKSIYVKFPLAGKEKEYFVIWTTTPWTLPSNTGIMVHPSYEYAYVNAGGETLIIAKELVKAVMKKAHITGYSIEKTVKGKDLKGTRYDHPLKSIIPVQKDVEGRVVTSHQYVTLEDGTGLVHTAPGHGKEDFKVGEANGLKKICPITLSGIFTGEVGKFSGMYVKDADKYIIEELEKTGALLATEDITHDYPKCWRCKTPLLQMAVPQWFFKVTAIRDKLLDENKKINWVPAWAKKRNKDWLESLGDWPISRQRYWGIPLPIWTCENENCDSVKVIGSKDELGTEIKDLHRPYIDKITFRCEKCSGTMKRIPDVLDVWFDSGVASWASLNYPKEKKLFNEMWPAKLNIEGPDQIRGWWNSEMITSVITFGRMPYETIMMHGFVLDAKGIKMSKSMGNVTGPGEVIEKYSRDILRFNLLSSAPENNFYFDWEKVKETSRFLNIYYNTYNFAKTYCTEKGRTDHKNLTANDRWIISKTNTLIKKCREHNNKYQGYRALNIIEDFIVNDFSRWYIKLIRPRVSKSYTGKDKKEASRTAWYVLEMLAKLMAPATPYLSEKIYLESLKNIESIHFEQYPRHDTSMIESSLEKDMEAAKQIVESINSARQSAGIKLRWPIKSATVVADRKTASAVKNTESVIKEITNTKELKYGKIELETRAAPNFRAIGPVFGKDTSKVVDLIRKEDPKKLKEKLNKGSAKLGSYTIKKNMVSIEEAIPENIAGEKFEGGAVYIDTTRDQGLLEESAVRELTRKVQMARKESDLDVTEVIDLYITGNEEFLEKWKTEIEKGTNSRLHTDKIEGKNKTDFTFEDIELKISF